MECYALIEECLLTLILQKTHVWPLIQQRLHRVEFSSRLPFQRIHSSLYSPGDVAASEQILLQKGTMC